MTQYVSMLSEFYFEKKNDLEVEKRSLRLRERLRISHETHSEILSKLKIQKKAIAHLSNFRLEFNENVIDAFAGHDTFWDFRYTNLSEDDPLKINLMWDDPETKDRVDFRAETKGFVEPLETVTIGGKAIFDRIGIKEISDLQLTISDQFGESANFRAESFRFKVGNHDTRITQNISTHNQISIEGRGVVDAGGMGPSKTITNITTDDQPRWRELKFTYIPTNILESKTVPKSETAVIETQPVVPTTANTNKLQATIIEFNKDDLLSLLKAAEEGSAEAQCELGIKYLWGNNVTQDYEKSFHWTRLAAEQGLALGQNYLGDHYLNGHGISKDYAKAIHWYGLAADQGHLLAQINLGDMYFLEGMGVAQDNVKAFHWYRLAAEQGDSGAQSRLGNMYEYGLGVVQDNAKAFQWYHLAAEQGNAEAQYGLAIMYRCGEVVALDNEKAVYWLLLAADQGDADAQSTLGYMYESGLGVVQDNAKAIQWYRLAAEQGDLFAQDTLRFRDDLLSS